MRTPLLLAFLLVPLCSSCLVAAAVGVGAIAGDAYLKDGVYSAEYNLEVHKVWASAKKTLAASTLDPIDYDDDQRWATAKVDSHKIKVSVETLDQKRTQVTVEATNMVGMSNGEIARHILDRIRTDLDR